MKEKRLPYKFEFKSRKVNEYNTSMEMRGPLKRQNGCVAFAFIPPTGESGNIRMYFHRC